MNTTPGIEFGSWLKSKRQDKKIIARVFAGLIGLSSAEYAEVEAGIVKWLREKQLVKIPVLLDFSEDDQAHFNHKHFLATEAGELEFEHIFDRDQLTPVRLCCEGEERLTPEKRDAILKAVFAPLN